MNIKELLGRFDKGSGLLQKTESETVDTAAGKVSEAASAAKTATAFSRSVSEAKKPLHLFKTTADSANAAAVAADDAYKAYGQLLADQSAAANAVAASLETAQAAYAKLQEEIGKTGAKIDSNKQIAEQFARNNNKMVLIIGGGVSGLMTAWILLDKGYRVSIVAKEWREKDKDKITPSPMTSQVAGALWEYPPGGCGLSEIEVPVLAYSKLAQYRTWAMQSFLFYEHLALSEDKSLKGFGSRMVTLYQLFHHSHEKNAQADDTDPVVRRALESASDHYKKWKAISRLDEESEDFRGKLKAAHLNLPLGGSPTVNPSANSEAAEKAAAEREKWENALEAISHDSEGFKLKWAYRHQAPVVNTDVAMEFLMKLVRAKGAILETREITQDLHLQERELKDDFKADIIVNASGLGARTLANDSQVFPVRGAVRVNKVDFLRKNAILLPAQYDVNNHPSKTIFIVPRSDTTLVVGSIIQRNNWNLGLTLQSPEVEDMWKRAEKFVPELGNLEPDDRPLAQGLRPFSHSNVRVSADNRTTACRVVHNYGHGGSGWTLAVGCAWTCVRIVEKILHEGKSGSVANAEVWGLDDP
ncbi:FAD dependent oxidoreductase-domain-containing protein [Cercophora samala]|uniref:FAD dependent oxidoreductase-domain-containing protein n=1 Tax=Cercophora samala TaxID=330535 RepID=A0AA39ZG81_9PEZI|nr:FAD dependent oxidoreductase-domain-containing protein [Cercophora samala]